MMKKFKIGEKGRYSQLYGGSIIYKIIDRTEDTITILENWMAEDTGEDVFKKIEYNIIKTDETEKILLWEYKGHECMMFPESYEVSA